MKKRKQKVAIIFGGMSSEHEISLISARNIIDNIDSDRYEKVLIGIDKNGVWYFFGNQIVFENEGNPLTISLPNRKKAIYLKMHYGNPKLIDQHGNTVADFHIIFPIIHGLNGEDGSIQGLAKLMGVPCVGCGILSSAACMDKEITKKFLKDNNIPTAEFITIRSNEKYDYREITNILGNSIFIKPARQGSSVGVSYVKNETTFSKSIQQAFLYDNKIIIEEKINGKEIECAILGNHQAMASVIGEIKPSSSFYSFESKYVVENDAKLHIPANITKEQSKMAKQLALRAYKSLECKGMARVDMFLKNDGSLLVNEINTIPGFTDISMYPNLWKYSGISTIDLLTQLITFAIERFDSSIPQILIN